MSRVFDKNIEATELILRIILGRKIKVIRVNGQEEVRNAEVGGRNITLDVYAMDETGQEMDIEVQGNSEGAQIRRARYHSSVMDSKMLKDCLLYTSLLITCVVLFLIGNGLSSYFDGKIFNVIDVYKRQALRCTSGGLGFYNLERGQCRYQHCKGYRYRK